MAPRWQRRRRQRKRRRPELNEDVIEEILLRIPPEEPAHLFRASFVCKLWLRVASDPAFRRRYSAFHRNPPLLGFFYNLESSGSFAGFIPATASSSLPLQGPSNWVRWVPDCRHDRVLLIGAPSSRILFEVWDPFSKRWDELEPPASCSSGFTSLYNTAVLCAIPGCDHRRGCRGGPYYVVCVGVDNSNSDYSIVHAHVYSSESRSWGSAASAQLGGGTHYFVDLKRPALIGDAIYCTVINDSSARIVVNDSSARILKYDLVEHRLSTISVPLYCWYRNVPVLLMQNEDGSLGIAGVKSSRLYLWSTTVDAEGVTRWVKQRVIELKNILPVDAISNQDNVHVNVIGFAEGAEVFFITTNAGAFTFELKSGRVRKVGEPKDYQSVAPFIGFITPDCGCNKWTK